MMSMLVGGSALALMSLNGLLFSLIILAVSQEVSVFARQAHALMQPEQWVRLYWEGQALSPVTEPELSNAWTQSAFAVARSHRVGR